MKIYNLRTKLYSENGNMRVILTKEIVDRDGEMVAIDGINIPDKGVPLLNSHNMYGDVVENVLGKVTNIQKVKKSSGNELIGEVEYAPTPKGHLAKTLVSTGFVDSVSIGFKMCEYDDMTRTIVKSELYEVSLVSVPANPSALFLNKSFKEQEEAVFDLEKTLNHYKTIKGAWDEFRKTFLSDELSRLLEFKKKGDLLIDINDLYTLLLKRLSETHKAKITSTQVKIAPVSSSINSATLQHLIDKAVAKYI